MVQGTGAQPIEAVVRGRLEMFKAVAVKVGALSSAWPAIVSWVGPDQTSSVANCTYADVMNEPAGIVRFWNRMPTTCVTPASTTNSMSLLLRFTPPASSSASSSLAAMVRSTVPLAGGASCTVTATVSLTVNWPSVALSCSV
jgi:hypothetical protein